MKTPRQIAIEQWDKLSFNLKLYYWKNYKKTTFSPSQSPTDLTGREIENIMKTIPINTNQMSEGEMEQEILWGQVLAKVRQYGLNKEVLDSLKSEFSIKKNKP